MFPMLLLMTGELFKLEIPGGPRVYLKNYSWLYMSVLEIDSQTKSVIAETRVYI